MIRLITTTLSLLVCTAITAQGVQFVDMAYDDVVSKAKKENKFIFVDVYADWCKPCKKMDEEVFPDSTLGAYMSANFVSYKVDGNSSVGKLLRRKYGVDSYPHFLFIDYRGNLVFKSRGYKSAENLIKDAQVAINPGIYNKYELYQRKYNAGGRDKEMLGEYLELDYLRYKEVNPIIFEEYFKQLDLMDKQDEKVVQRVAKYVPYADGRAYDLAKDYYLRMKDDTSQADIQQIRDNLALAIDRTIARDCENKNGNHLNDLLIKKEELLFESNPQDTLDNIKEVELTRLNFFVCTANKEEYREGSVSFVEAFLWDNERFKLDTTVDKSIQQIGVDIEDAAMLGEFADQYLTFYKEKEALHDAEEWIKQAIKWDDKLEYHGTLALLTNALGDKSEAVNIARRALERARKTKDDYALEIQNVLMTIVDGEELKKGVK